MDNDFQKQNSGIALKIDNRSQKFEPENPAIAGFSVDFRAEKC